MIDFKALKVSFFSERDNMDEVVRYAGQIAGNAGVTVAMVAYNTLLNQLEVTQAREIEVKEKAEKLISEALCNGRQLLEKDDPLKDEILEYIANTWYWHHFKIKDLGENSNYLQVAFVLTKTAQKRCIIEQD